jgi:UDP-N-acetylmuramate dehydrogenase
MRLGGAAVSDWHGNILINEKNATSGEIVSLMTFVQNKVKEQTGYLLEPEVLKIGEWEDL